MQFIPYLDFDGDAAEAFDFYARAFQGQITARMLYGQSPMAAQMPAQTHGRVMHTQLESAGGILMGADSPPGARRLAGCVNVSVDSAAEAERVFQALAEGGEVSMPMAETFWAHRFGMLTDRYGKPWMINCLRKPGE